MATDLNDCTFVGRLGADPEVRYMPSGEAVTNFRIACGWKTKEKEGVEWVPVVTYNKLAEICAEWLKKGAQVLIKGRFRTRSWKDKETGKDRYSTEIHCDFMQMLGSKRDDSEPVMAKPTHKADGSAVTKPAPRSGGMDNFDDDIPF